MRVESVMLWSCESGECHVIHSIYMWNEWEHIVLDTYIPLPSTVSHTINSHVHMLCICILCVCVQ